MTETKNPDIAETQEVAEAVGQICALMVPAFNDVTSVAIEHVERCVVEADMRPSMVFALLANALTQCAIKNGASLEDMLEAAKFHHDYFETDTEVKELKKK